MTLDGVARYRLTDGRCGFASSQPALSEGNARPPGGHPSVEVQALWCRSPADTPRDDGRECPPEGAVGHCPALRLMTGRKKKVRSGIACCCRPNLSHDQPQRFLRSPKWTGPNLELQPRQSTPHRSRLRPTQSRQRAVHPALITPRQVENRLPMPTQINHPATAGWGSTTPSFRLFPNAKLISQIQPIESKQFQKPSRSGHPFQPPPPVAEAGAVPSAGGVAGVGAVRIPFFHTPSLCCPAL